MTDPATAITWFDTHDFGVVDRVDDEGIVTAFYTVLLPVWPDHSAYVFRGPNGEPGRIKLALQPRSVVLGYLRAPTWLAALVLAAPAALVPGRAWLFLPAAVLGIVAALLTFVAGRLGEPERLRRALLCRVIGFGAPPELLDEELRAEIRAGLLARWHARSPRRRWTDAIELGDAHELLVALAEYHRAPHLVARARESCAARVWN